MAQSDAKPPTAISIDELIALNDEIAALARAGVPLESALGELGRDLPGRLGRIAADVARRSSQGESLLEITSLQSAKMPPVYRAVVEAGLKSGRLSVALEALAGSIRRVAQTRRSVATAAFYPLLVLTIAWALCAFIANSIAPALLQMFAEFDVPGRELFVALARWGGSARMWGPALPAAVMVATALWWYCSGRASIVQPHRAARLMGWLPWMGGVLRLSHTATFAEVLALLVENRVPLNEAVVLAAEASGDRRSLTAARRMADAIVRGDPLTGSSAAAADGGFPPLLTWLLTAGRHHDALLPALRHAAETYRRRATHQAELARVFLPVVLTIVIGGGTTLAYTLAMFIPYTSMLSALGGP